MTYARLTFGGYGATAGGRPSWRITKAGVCGGSVSLAEWVVPMSLRWSARRTSHRDIEVSWRVRPSLYEDWCIWILGLAFRPPHMADTDVAYQHAKLGVHGVAISTLLNLIWKQSRHRKLAILVFSAQDAHRRQHIDGIVSLSRCACATMGK
jgi:hypothetical protein